MNSFWRELRESLRHPEFWAISSWLDIVVKHRKSSLGILWLFMPSVIYVWGMGYYFAVAQGRTMATFAVHVALGSMIFKTLMSSIMESTSVFGGNRSFIMDGHMRLTDYLLEALAKSFFYSCTYIPVTVVAMLIFPDLNLHAAVWMPLSFVIVYINALWITVVFSLVGARYPDFGQFMGNTSIFLFLLTPIIWYPEQMPADSFRGQLMRFNPFYHLITVFRAPILGERVEMFSIYYIAVMTVAGLALATFLYRRYARFVPLWI
jgi:ABC-type polysaccharide/polyol phosphate export permease